MIYRKEHRAQKTENLQQEKLLNQSHIYMKDNGERDQTKKLTFNKNRSCMKKENKQHK